VVIGSSDPAPRGAFEGDHGRIPRLRSCVVIGRARQIFFGFVMFFVKKLDYPIAPRLTATAVDG
jgi:hypothetical protein